MLYSFGYILVRNTTFISFKDKHSHGQFFVPTIYMHVDSRARIHSCSVNVNSKSLPISSLKITLDHETHHNDNQTSQTF